MILTLDLFLFANSTNEFSNELEAGKTYSSTRKIKSGEEVGKVIVTITDNDGKSESITINNK
jgi:hypothetical protein